MFGDFDLLDSVAPVLDEAQARIEAARNAIQTLLAWHDGDHVSIQRFICRLDSMVMDLRRAEETVNSQAGIFGAVDRRLAGEPECL